MIKLFVFDTNSLISANLSPISVNRRAFDLGREVGIPIYSISTLAEFTQTILRPKFDRYVSIESRFKSIAALEKAGQLINVSINVDICRDQKDDKFLELALEAGAACIITGDKDLLVLNPFQGIPIITASEFLELY